ncbi:MAG: LacI family DNA-binding transcriptional regulator, partial [Xanthomonadales bacterium]
MATIYEVSKLAGVSLATVSRVMNNSGKVAAATRKRVEAAMLELGYRPNSIAQSLASNRSNCVGVLVSELHGPIFGDMLGTIEEELRRAGKFAIFSAGHNEAGKER